MRNAAAPSQSLESRGALVNWPRYFKALVRLIGRKRAFHNLCLPTQTVPKASPVCQHHTEFNRPGGSQKPLSWGYSLMYKISLLRQLVSDIPSNAHLQISKQHT